MKGTLQGGIRVDISIERLVAAMSGPDYGKARKEAIPVVKLYGSLFLNCRETAVPLRTVLDSLP